jgi:1,4-dihydroxy-2-naphthoyl-CoA hydrolase
MKFTAEHMNRVGAGKLPGHLGIVITQMEAAKVVAELPIVATLMAPNGYLHAASVIALADTCSGYGCIANLPAGAAGFTTVELKSNHLGTALDGTIVGIATPAHLGKTTQVWDAVVTHKESGKAIALFRCTQLILYTRPKSAAEQT